MILADVTLQIFQVLCVLLLAPLLQGFILKQKNAFSEAADQASFSRTATCGSCFTSNA